MLHIQGVRVAQAALPQAAVNNAAVTTIEIDSVSNGVKADVITFYILLGNTDTAFSTLKVLETDTTGTAYTDVPGGAFNGTAKDGVTANPVFPNANDDNKIYAITIKLNGARKRFFKLSAVLGAGSTGAFVTVLAVLSRLHESPNSAARRGIAGEILA